jgi:broad specificity phosphatase PhoE
MVIRHGEKPSVKHRPPYGVTADGEQDWESLTVRGWLRAGALQNLFAPSRGRVDDQLATPTIIYVSRPRDLGVPTAHDDLSKSKRPLQTITPLAAKLEITPILEFGKGDEAKLATDILNQAGVVLISWQHEKIYDIAQHLVGEKPPEPAIPTTKWPEARFDLVWVFDPPSQNGRWKFAQVPQKLLLGDRGDVIT